MPVKFHLPTGLMLSWKKSLCAGKMPVFIQKCTACNVNKTFRKMYCRERLVQSSKWHLGHNLISRFIVAFLPRDQLVYLKPKGVCQDINAVSFKSLSTILIFLWASEKCFRMTRHIQPGCELDHLRSLDRIL